MSFLRPISQIEADIAEADALSVAPKTSRNQRVLYAKRAELLRIELSRAQATREHLNAVYQSGLSRPSDEA